MMAFVPNGGPKKCNFGCLGFGECVKACPFDAIHIKMALQLLIKSNVKPAVNVSKPARRT